MGIVNAICTALFDVIYAPLNVLPHWGSLTLISAVVGVAALVVVKYASNQTSISRIKDDIKADMLSIKLYKDDLGVMFRAQRRLIWSALRMQYHMLLPVLIMFIPFVLIAAQMGLRYQWRPLEVGEELSLDVRVADGADLDLELLESDGFESSTKRIRNRVNNMVSWRIKASRGGIYPITVTDGREEYTKRIAVGGDVDRVCPVRPGGSFLDRLIYPAEPPFAADSVVQSIELMPYPVHQGWYAAADWWLVWFLVVSMVAALILKPVLKVKF